MESQEDDSMGLPLPYNISSNPNPPQNPPNPSRVSAFSKPSPLLSPVIRNGSATHDFTNNPISLSPPPPAAAAAAASDHHPDHPTGTATAAAAATTPKTPAAAAAAAIKYRECLRNHAAAFGGHVLDGCCEFMPCDADPLRCAACDCHRSFHRKYDQGSEHTIGSTTSSAYYHHHRDRISVPLLLPPPHPTTAHHGHPSQTYHHRSQSQKQQFASSATFPASPSGVIPSGVNPAVVAFGGLGGNNSGSGATTESSSEERLDGSTAAPLTTPQQQQQQQQQQIIMSKKRFRTKFTPEQKEKMMGFAERVGWRIQRQDDATLEQFCREVGVRRQVLKVWMHNNKHSIKKQQQQQLQPPAATTSDSATTATFGHVM